MADFRDRYGRKVYPRGRSMRMMKDYDKTYYKYGDKRDIASHWQESSPESIQQDEDRINILRHPEWFGEGSIYAVDKSGHKGRSSYSDEWDTRLQMDGIDNERGYVDRRGKTRWKDIGPYTGHVGEITYGAGYTDEERRKLPKTIKHFSPEATWVSDEFTEESKFTRGPFKNEKQRQKLIGLLEKQGL